MEVGNQNGTPQGCGEKEVLFSLLMHKFVLIKYEYSSENAVTAERSGVTYVTYICRQNICDEC